MAQWMSLHWNNSSVNQTQLLLLCEKSIAILLVLVGLMKGSPAGQQLELDSKILTDCTIRIFMVFSKRTLLGRT